MGTVVDLAVYNDTETCADSYYRVVSLGFFMEICDY